jgi:hypothetical protein
MCCRYPLLHPHVTEHHPLLLIVSTHTSVLEQIPVEKKYLPWDFFSKLFSRAIDQAK